MSKFSFRQRIARFMYGRYGMDQLYNFTLIACLVLLVINIFVRSYIISLVEYALLIWALWRTFSKNIVKRRIENQKYLQIQGKVVKFFDLIRCRFRDRKTHVYRKCPGCKNNLRLPRKKGTHTVNCPCCHKSFDVTI